VADISSIKDLLLRVKELGIKARLYEPSLSKAGGHLHRLGAENDKERSARHLRFFSCFVADSTGVAGYTVLRTFVNHGQEHPAKISSGLMTTLLIGRSEFLNTAVSR